DISLVENQIRERIEELLAHLEEEKRWAEKELGEVKKALEEVPETWLREQELQFSAEMSRSMLEGMVQLVETKNIENNLVSIESKPIDPAQASMIPKSLRLKVFGGVGFFLGGLITFAGAIIWGVLRGLPLSLENIKVRGKRVLGTLSRGSDLNLIRTCCLWVDEKKVETPIVMLLLDHRKDYSLPLANVLGKEGKRVAHLPLNFEKEKDRSPSLAHYLGGEVKEPIFVERSFGHTIPIGGGSYTEEILKSKKLPPFIETLKQSYDVILFSIPSSPKETLPKHLFPFANHLILTLGNASYEDLIPYFAWEQEGHHLAFIH
ncbi:MAG: hypothetical protein KDK60_03715, partial [Chlamydiia bacterium]|nr:hypothetical protein [Chlamydiia bacterium]